MPNTYDPANDFVPDSEPTKDELDAAKQAAKEPIRFALAQPSGLTLYPERYESREEAEGALAEQDEDLVIVEVR